MTEHHTKDILVSVNYNGKAMQKKNSWQRLKIST